LCDVDIKEAQRQLNLKGWPPKGTAEKWGRDIRLNIIKVPYNSKKK